MRVHLLVVAVAIAVAAVLVWPHVPRTSEVISDACNRSSGARVAPLPADTPDRLPSLVVPTDGGPKLNVPGLRLCDPAEEDRTFPAGTSYTQIDDAGRGENGQLSHALTLPVYAYTEVRFAWGLTTTTFVVVKLPDGRIVAVRT